MESAVRKKKRPSAPAHASSCKTSSKVPGEDCVCFVCHDGGTLIMCDRRQCPKAYHPECVGRNLAFFKTKGAWLCARHFCSKCWKQPCTYCVMCPNSFCLKCLSGMQTEDFLQLSEAAGLCEACMRLVKMIELQHTIDGMAVNFEDSETFEFLFKEYWLLLKGFHGYTLMNYAPADAARPLPGSSDNVKIDDMPSVSLDDKQRPNYKARAPLQITPAESSQTQETISVPRDVQVSIKRRSANNDSSSPAKKKIRVLKLLNDSSSDDGDKPLSTLICVGKQEANSACKLLTVNKTLSGEITESPLFTEALDGLSKTFSVRDLSSPSKHLLVVDDSSQAVGVAVNTLSPLHPEVSPPMETPQPVISLPPLQADVCKSPADRNLWKRARSSKVSSENNRQNLKLANNAIVCAKRSARSIQLASPTPLTSARKSPGRTKLVSPTAIVSGKKFCQSSKMASSTRTTPQPRSTLASISMPLPIAVNSSTLSASKESPNLSSPYEPRLTETDSLKTSATEPSQRYGDTSNDKPSNASSDFKGPSLMASAVLPAKRLHGGSIVQGSCSNVEAASSTSYEETLAPINVQNVNLIYLRRSHLEELLSDERFTTLVLGAFVRIRNLKQGNNYRLVQIAGTSLQSKYYQAGEKQTNVLLEVVNLNRRQCIKIDHVSNNMYTEEECQRLQQSVELGFINAPTMRALVEKAAALRKAKANKCLDEKLANLSSKVRPMESGLVDKELRKSLDEGSNICPSSHQSVKPHTGPHVDDRKQVEAEQESASLELATGLAGKETASYLFQEKKPSECWISGINEQLKREHQDNLTTGIQNKAQDGLLVFEASQAAAEKQGDGDQHSDISVELATISSDKGKRKMHLSEKLFPVGGEICPEDVNLSDKTQQKGYQSFGSGKYHMKEQRTSLMAGVLNKAQGDGTIEAHPETQVSVSEQMDTSQHYDISTGKAEDKMHAAKILSISAVKGGTQDEVAMNLSQGKEFQGYGTYKHPTRQHDTGITYQSESQTKGDGCGKEYIPTVVAMNDMDKGAMESMQWFYQDMKERSFGPFSLKQLKKWNSTGVFPPNLKIWRKVAGQRSFIFLTDALIAQEMEVPFRMGTEKCAAERGCSDPASQREDIYTESGTTCHTLVKEMFGDRGMPTEKGRFNSVSSPKSTHLNMKDVSGKQCANETSSNWKDPVTAKIFEKAVNAPSDISTDRCHSLEMETFCEGERKLSPAHTLANEIPDEEESEGKSSLALTLAKEISGEEETKGRHNPAYIEGTDQMLDTLVTLDDGWSLPDTGKNNSGTLWTTLQSTQFDILEEKFLPVKTFHCGKSSTFVINKECEKALHLSEQTKAISAESGWRFQNLTKEASSDGKRDGKSISVHTEQKKETLVASDDGWTLPETGEFESETLWATQFEALNREAEIIRCRDEELNNLIDAVTTREYKNEMSPPTEREEVHAESGWQCHTISEERLTHENKKTCNAEQDLDRFVALDDGWTAPDMKELEQGTPWASLNSIRDNSSEKNHLTKMKCLDRISIEKLQPSKGERDETQTASVLHGAQRNVDSISFERKEGRSLSYDRHAEEHQRWIRSSPGHARADCNGSIRGRDTCRRSRQRDYFLSKSHQVHASNWRRNDAGEGIERELKRSYAEDSNMCQKIVVSRRYHGSSSSERNSSPTNAEKCTEKEFIRSHSREHHKQDRCRSDKKCFAKEQEEFPRNAGTERVEDARRSYSRNGWKSVLMERKASPENAGKRTERVQRIHSRNERRSISRERKASPESAGIATEKEFRRPHSRNNRISSSKAGKTSESAEERTEKEIRRSHSRNDRRSISRGRNASPKISGKREVKRSHSRTERRSISREQKASPESAGERAEKKVKISHSREPKASLESARKTEIQRPHSRIDQRSISKEEKSSSDSAGRRTEQEVRRSHSRNHRRSISWERKASPENAGKRTKNEVRRSHSRRSNSTERKDSSKKVGRRIEEEVWKCLSRDNMRSPPEEQMMSPSSSTHRSLSRSIDDALRSTSFSRERRDFLTHSSCSCVYRSFSRNLDTDMPLERSKEQRWELSRYADNAAEKSSVRERTSPYEERIQPSPHVLYPNESILQQSHSGEQGWTPPQSPLNFAPKCVSPGVAEVEKPGDPHPLSGMLGSKAPSGPQEFLLHPGSPELVVKESYKEVPPLPPLPFQTAPNYMKLPPPPPLPAETSTLCHIDHYATCTIVN